MSKRSWQNSKTYSHPLHDKVHLTIAQKGLRPLIYNFYPYLSDVKLDAEDEPKIKPHQVYNVLGNYRDEMFRTKDRSPIFRLRQFLGIPNIRIFFDRAHDVVFSYGGMLLTNKPYVIYMENDIAPYAYNLSISKKRVAKYLFRFFISRRNCKHIVFMSNACKNSFFATSGFLPKTIAMIEKKSSVLSPLAQNPGVPQPLSQQDGIIRFLFIGLFYMKGGKELLHAFRRLLTERENIRLTIITKRELISPEDIQTIESIPQIALISNDYDPPYLFQHFYNTHDIFVYPTYRDSFGAVLVEALAASMPIITTDHYATTEMAISGYNACVYPNHPLKDYDPASLRMLGKYYNPKDFYNDLFSFQSQGAMKPIENFLYTAMESLVSDAQLRHAMGRHSKEHYAKTYDYRMLAKRWNDVFVQASRI
jgi:glycosyltransferase involved in cell wall biosynthesis